MKDYKSLMEILYREKPFEKFTAAIDGYTVVDEFDKIFPELRKVAKAKKFDAKTLYLHAENSVWRSELNLNKEIIITKINKFFGKEIIKNIKFI